jgi:hypothetical protein
MPSSTSVLRSFRGQRLARVVTLGLVVAGVSGVAITGMPERADTPIRPTVHRDVDSWAMPLDGYVRPSDDLENQAEQLLLEPCLTAAGATWDVPHRDPDALVALDDARNTATRGNPAPALASTRPLAADRGYHGVSTASANEAAWQRWAFDPARNTVDEDVFAGCLQDARASLHVGRAESGTQQAASDTALRLTYIAAIEARSDAPVEQAAERWRACMTAAGVRDLPRAPSGMLTRELRDRFGAVIPGTPISDDETATATLDVGCQTSSGYRARLYDAEWNRLVRVTASDAATLSRADPDMPAVSARLRATVLRLQT